MGNSGDIGARGRQLARHLQDDLRLDQGLVALHIDDDGVAAPATLFDDFGQTVGAGRVVAARHERCDFVRLGDGPDLRMISCHPDLLGARQSRPLGHPDNHRLATEIKQRFAR